MEAIRNATEITSTNMYFSFHIYILYSTSTDETFEWFYVTYLEEWSYLKRPEMDIINDDKFSMFNLNLCRSPLFYTTDYQKYNNLCVRLRHIHLNKFQYCLITK